MSFKEVAVNILMFFSYILGVETYPANNESWEVNKSWVEMDNGHLSFSATNRVLVEKCKNNPSFYIEFPSIIHSSSKLIVDGKIIAITNPEDFQHTHGFYSALVVPCSQLYNVNNLLEWSVISPTVYFARFHHFPRIVEDYPRDNFFNETLNIMGAGILMSLCFLYLILFTGKISQEKLASLIFSNLFTSFYFITAIAGFTGYSISMLIAHKIADAGLWLGFLFFVNFLYLEGLILKWMNIMYKTSIFVALFIIAIAGNGDAVQLGTSVPFLFTILIPGYAIVKLLQKGKLKSRKDTIQLIALSISFLVYWNDVSMVTGFLDLVPLLPLGIAASYIFILLSVNESIISTYIERDKLKVLAKELQRANTNLKKTQNNLIESEKMASMGRAVARIAHELNTPLYLVKSSVQNIQTQTTKLLGGIDNKNDSSEILSAIQQYQSDIKTMTNNMMTSSSRASELVRTFKEVSADQINIRKRRFNLKNYIKTSISSMDDLCKENNLTFDIKGDEVDLTSDPGLFYQIMQNLLTNVAKYAYDNGGVVEVKIKDSSKIVEIIFSDFGRGIAKQNLSKIFDAFYTTGGGMGGVGLGLNIVYKIVTSQLNGKITCTSKQKEGTVFTIIIPK